MVYVLMSTYNGENYIEEQLKSIINQKNVDLKILVRDDGSKDMTLNILKRWHAEGLLNWYTGKNLKPAKSFMDLIAKCPEADYYAFSDQDDIWLEDKLYVAINKLNKFKSIPALYYCQTQLVNSKLEPIPTQQLNPNISLSQALINHTATGCTIVFNNQLREKLLLYNPQYITMHDSWCQLVCLAIGGKVIFDSKPYILYRQHNNNVLGMHVSWKKKWIRRLKKNLINPEKERSKTVHELLYGYKQYITDENNIKLLNLIEGYNSNIIKKIKLLFSTEFKPLSFKYNVLFRLSVFFNRF